MDMTPPPGTTIVKEVTDWLEPRVLLPGGVTCPGCWRHAEIYHYAMKPDWIETLAAVVCSPDEWVYLPYLRAVGQKEPLMRHWGLLIRQEGFARDDYNPRTGYYKDPDLTLRFLLGEVPVPHEIKIFADRFLGFVDENDTVSVHDVYRRHFDFIEWRANNPQESDTSDRRNTFRAVRSQGHRRTIKDDGLDSMTMPLDDVHPWLIEHANKGCECPCCGQNYQIFPRTFTERWAEVVLKMKWAHEHGQEWIRLADEHFKTSGKDESQMKHWPLVNHVGDRWQLNETGWGVARGTLTIPRTAMVLNDVFQGFLNPDDRVNCQSALGEYNYERMMHGAWGYIPPP